MQLTTEGRETLQMKRWVNRGMSNNVPLKDISFFFFYLVFHLLWPASGDCVDLFCAALRWLFISQATKTTTTTTLESSSWDGQTMANMPQSTLHTNTNSNSDFDSDSESTLIAWLDPIGPVPVPDKTWPDHAMMTSCFYHKWKCVLCSVQVEAMQNKSSGW